MNRRAFLLTAAAAAGAGRVTGIDAARIDAARADAAHVDAAGSEGRETLSPARGQDGGGAGAVSPKPRLTHLGVQAGVVRAALTRDLASGLEQIAAIGYTEVELQWYSGIFGQTPAALRAALDRAGLRAVSALLHTGAVMVGWERHLDAARVLGIEYLSVVNFSEDERQTLADWHEWADRFNRAGEAARKKGMWLALHNEPQFMTPVDERIPYEDFVARTDPSLVVLEMDVGNMTRAGHDPVRYLRQHPDRYRLFHLKDVPDGPDGDRPLGKGRVEFQRILAAIPTHRERAHFFVEHAVDPAAPFDSLRQSYAYLAQLRL